MKIIKEHKVYTVSEVNYFAKVTLEQMIVWVEGEVSAFNQNPNWAFNYLDLKDDRALLPCIVSNEVIGSLASDLLNQTVIAFGNLSLYEKTGKYQLTIRHIELSGQGHLFKKLEELISKLRQEGLFDAKNKKELPLYPKNVCIVSSVGSDAWNDFKTHSTGKFPIIKLTSVDVRVQGHKSVTELLEVLPKVDQKGFDLVAITRGGGSLEDLAAFNDEDVSRAIFKMKTPTIVAIGHESNESLAEWVADARASTPTDAANIVTRGWREILDKLTFIQTVLTSKFERLSEFNFQRLDNLWEKLTRTKIRLQEYPYRLDLQNQSLKRHKKLLLIGALTKEKTLFDSLKKNAIIFLKRQDDHLLYFNQSLTLLSPENTLKRGYSITTDENDKVIKTARDIVIGKIIGVKLARGKIIARVNAKSEQ